MPGFASDETVAAQAMFTGICARDMGGMAEGEEVHVNALACSLEEGEPECEIGLDGRGEADVTAFGGLVLGGSDATQEVASLGNQEATAVEMSDEGVKGLI